MSIVKKLQGIVTVDSLEIAIALVERARWDEHGSSLSGDEIWGNRGEFAASKATSNYTYEAAIRTAVNYFGDDQ